jgi:phospholipase/lecithinase/hemolysin
MEISAMRITPASMPAAFGSLEFKPVAPARSTRSSNRRPCVSLGLLSTLLLIFTSVGANAQAGPPTPEYTSIVVFGDSLSDTGNLAHLTYDKYGFRVPGPIADYTDGRFTDGFDTLPPAQNYSGVWIEQLAESIPSKPVVKSSLDGGTDYAYGFATTGSGTSVFAFGPGNSLSVNVENIGQQITDYLATHPRITPKTLFVVWGGANDLLNATSQSDVIEAGINQTLNIQRLIDAGATQFIVPNLPPLGLTPRLNGSLATSIPATAASALYNSVLGSGVSLILEFNRNKHLHIAQLDVFALYTWIVASPANYSLTNVTASSQGMPVDPDTYLFWDDLHPTSHGHNILAVTAASILARSNCMNDASNVGSGVCAGVTP